MLNPAQILDLTNWKLTLPIGASESPTEVKQPALATFSDAYFMAVDGDTAVAFRAPVNGVTTSGSGYPRSELREMSGSNLASWGGDDGKYHTFLEELAWTALPTGKPQVVGGQIHDASNDLTVFRLEGPNLWLTLGNTTHHKLLLNDYVLGTKVQLAFVVGHKKCLVYLNGALVDTLDASNWSKAYFKAGCYTQANCSNSSPCSATNFGETHIYRLKVTHGAVPGDVTFPTSQPPPPGSTPPVEPPPVVLPPVEPVPPEVPPVSTDLIVMIARHGEKPDSKHPGYTDITFSVKDAHSLTANGWIRARDLYPDAFQLPKAGLYRPDAIYAADGPVAGDRMKETASFLAPALGLTTILKFDKGQESALAKELKTRVGKVSLVIWEHGNIPTLVKDLGGTVSPKMFKTWPDDRYDVVLVLKSSDLGKTWKLAQVLEAIGLPGEKTTPIK